MTVQKEDLTMFSHTAIKHAFWSSGDNREKFLSRQLFTKWSATHLKTGIIGQGTLISEKFYLIMCHTDTKKQKELKEFKKYVLHRVI